VAGPPFAFRLVVMHAAPGG